MPARSRTHAAPPQESHAPAPTPLIEDLVDVDARARDTSPDLRALARSLLMAAVVLERKVYRVTRRGDELLVEVDGAKPLRLEAIVDVMARELAREGGSFDGSDVLNLVSKSLRAAGR